MIKSIVLLLSLAIALASPAQKCLDISIVSAMGKLETPGNAESSFKKCNTQKNERGQVVILNYGTDLQQLDTVVIGTVRDFNTHYVAAMGVSSAQAPSQQQIEDTKALAENIKNMTPEQQKEWAMNMASQHSTGGTSGMQEDPSLSRLVMQIHNLAVIQMKSLNDEFSAKIVALNTAAAAEIQAIPPGDKSKCPADQTGLAYCECPNRIDAEYWKKVIPVRDKYDAQKTAIYLSYLPKIKEMAAEVDNAVIKCKYGDAIHSSQLKTLLYSAQSSAFANAFLVTSPLTEQIRKEGSDVCVNKLNSDLGVFEISCATK